MNLYMVI